MPKEILHDSHKMHPLVLHRTGSPAYRCNGCGCPGLGSRYRCDVCNFDLHEFCATCPPTTTLSFYGQHPLTLEREVFVDDPHTCDLCDRPIQGMHYSCRPCDFDVHPVCSQLPAATVSPLHPEHLVMLAVATPTECTLCSTDCSWGYRCFPCGVNLHPRCLLGSDKTPLSIPKEEGHRPKDLADSSSVRLGLRRPIDE
ncbi:hypothetical protein ACQ4PT_058536 [Festuca glaucescens]